MLSFLIAIIILILIYFLIIEVSNKNKRTNPKELNLAKFTTNNYVMTQTELIFYRELKKVTDKMDLCIFPQVDLERIIKVKDNNISDRNRIKSRSIDYTIVENKKCKIICCIELDDKSHNNEKSKVTDNFKNELFKNVGIPLIRFKVKDDYTKDLRDFEKSIIYSLK